MPPDGLLRIDEATIRRHGPGHALAVLWRQWRAERQLRRQQIRFRSTDLEELSRAYLAMSPAEFAAINARQDWANWRTIPRALSGNLPDRPLLVLDLGCGAGSSTQVLACYCPPGSRIIGYELVPSLLDLARRRAYRHQGGRPARVEFVCQGVTEPLPHPDLSVDLVNASGIVGHHLDARSVLPLIGELQRVLKADGVASLDVGPTLGRAELTRLMTSAGFTCRGHYKSWLFDPTGQLVFRKDA